MKIILTPEESLDLFHDALCDALGYMSGYGLELTYNEKEYESSRSKLDSPAFEDVLKQMLLDGYSLTMVDHEGDGEYTRTITLKDVETKVQEAPQRHLFDAILEDGDAETADVILQTVFFGDIIFG